MMNTSVQRPQRVRGWLTQPRTGVRNFERGAAGCMSNTQSPVRSLKPRTVAGTQAPCVALKYSTSAPGILGTALGSATPRSSSNTFRLTDGTLAAIGGFTTGGNSSYQCV